MPVAAAAAAAAKSLQSCLTLCDLIDGNPLQCSCLENPRDWEPGGLPSMGSHRVGHDYSYLAAAASVTDGKESTCNARDLGSVHGVSKSQI